MKVSLWDRRTVQLLPHLMATQWALEVWDFNWPEDGIMMTVVLKRK